MVHHVEQTFAGRQIRFETGRLAKQAAGSVLVQFGETMVLVASIDGTLSGFAIMKFRDAESHLFLLGIAPRFQRTGIGSALLGWLEKSCRTAGICNIRVELRAANRPARQFYERAGFRLARQIEGYYDNREAAIVMVRSLIGNH